MSDDELVEHRLSQLEAWRREASAALSAMQSSVELLKAGSAAVRESLAELRTEIRDRDEHIRATLREVREVLGQISNSDAREEGWKEAQQRTWKVVGWSVMATIAFGGLVVGILTLALGH